MALAQLLDESGGYNRYPWMQTQPPATGYSEDDRASAPEMPKVINDPGELLNAAQREAGGFQLHQATGDWGNDFLAIANRYSPSAKNLEQFVFPEFSQLYPGFSMKRNASGYVDAIIAPNGGIYDTQRNSGYDKSDAWQWNLAGGPGMSAYSAQFSDPLTAQYEQLLQSQTQLYQQQQQRMQQEAQRQEASRAQTEAAIKNLMTFVNQRVDRLKQPAYTNEEAEVLRTRALEPIERDRSAATQRALQFINGQGYDPSSGIAKQLLLDVNRGYDEDRSRAQNDLAYKQIDEQRSRDQEVQQLLQYAAQAPEAAARGDLNFLAYLDDMVNKPGSQALATGGTLADLPVQRTQLASQILGLGGQPQSSVPNLLQLLNQLQTNRYTGQAQNSDFWRSIGLSLLG